MWVSGTGIALDYKTVTGRAQTTREIVSQYEAGDRDAVAAMDRFAPDADQTLIHAHAERFAAPRFGDELREALQRLA